MIGAPSLEQSFPKDNPRVPTSTKKQRFPLGAYNQLKKERLQAELEKKLETDNKINQVKADIIEKEAELQRRNEELHNFEEKLRRKKRKIADLKTDLEDNSAEMKKIKRPTLNSVLDKTSSEKLNLSRHQFRRRKRKTLNALRPIHCSPFSVKDNKPIYAGMWTTLVSDVSKKDLTTYVEKSTRCMEEVIPTIVKKRVKSYEKSMQNKVRSMRVLYQGGLISKRKYSSIRNSTDTIKETEKKRKKNQKTEFIKGCEIPKILPYKDLMAYISTINIGELQSLDTLTEQYSTESSPGVYRPLKPFLIRLADLYIQLDEKIPCLHWFNGKHGVMYIAIGADGAPFGKNETSTAYLVSILNLLKRVQSCHENHLLMGANVAEDHPLMLQYTKHLKEEMKDIEGKVLETDNGHNIVFQFKLIPCDMKWASVMSGELNNCAYYFSPFANVHQDNKNIIGGSIGGSNATWKEWDYQERIKTAEEVEKFKRKLKDPGGKQRNQVTKFISKNKSRQEHTPPLGQYVGIIKAEPLHNTNNGWQQWFNNVLTIAMAHTKVPPSASLSGIQDNTPLMKLMKCVKDTAHCTRLFKSFERWFNEKRSKGLTFSYRFTGLESKRFSWHFSSMVHEVLAFPTLSKGSVLKIHCLAFIGLQLRDAASIYSRVELDRSQVDDLKTLCQHYFNTYSLLLAKVNPTIWTIGYAIPQHTNQLFDDLGYGLGLNSMQGREAKHIQLAKYTENTCNVQKHLRWWIVFRHEFVCQIWLREMDPFSTTYEENRTDSFIPKKVQESDKAMCYCGMPKEAADEGCRICTSDLLIAIKETAVSGKISPQIKTFVDLPPFANGKK